MHVNSSLRSEICKGACCHKWYEVEAKRRDAQKLRADKCEMLVHKVSFQWKNPDFLLKNPDFLMKNPDFLLKNADVVINQGTRFYKEAAFDEVRQY